MNYIDDFRDFMSKSITNFHAIEEVKQLLIRNNFIELDEKESWNLCKSRSYFVIRDDTSILAFKGVNKAKNAFHIIASHSDSPSFVVKPIASLRKGVYTMLNVEPYGGMIMSTWLDRPLGLAGRCLVQTAYGIKSVLVNFDSTVIIPNVAIHFNRTINSGYAYNPQVDLLPMLGMNEIEFTKKLNEIAGGEVVSYDLSLYNKEPLLETGLNKEFISSSRLDDLECVYTSLQSFLQAKKETNAIDVFAVFNNEEVGSLSMNGADSNFLVDTLRKITEELEASTDTIFANSMILSSDNAHAVHPTHPEFTDEENNCKMNQGIVIKRQAGLRYTTNAITEGVVRYLWDKEKIPYQIFTNRSNIPGGSTLGAISQRHLSIHSCDVGLAQLAMHSSYETAGAKDIEYAIRAFQSFYESSIEFEKDKINIQ